MPYPLEVKSRYVDAIDAIWSGSMQRNTLSSINENVVRIMDQAISEIAQCSKPYGIANAMFSYLYSPPTSRGALLAASGSAVGDVKKWIGLLRENSSYQGCINATATRYKLELQEALHY